MPLVAIVAIALVAPASALARLSVGAFDLALEKETVVYVYKSPMEAQRVSHICRGCILVPADDPEEALRSVFALWRPGTALRVISSKKDQNAAERLAATLRRDFGALLIDQVLMTRSGRE
jgi:hypothetical protein